MLCGPLDGILWWRILVVFVKLFVLYVLHAGENSLQAQTALKKAFEKSAPLMGKLVQVSD